jgi:hypothetical protein
MKTRFLPLVLLLSVPLMWGSTVFSQSMSPEYNYARNRPGIVMVQAIFSATVRVNRLAINELMFDNLVDSVKTLDTTGTILSPGQKLDIVVKALYKTPLRFF